MLFRFLLIGVFYVSQAVAQQQPEWLLMQRCSADVVLKKTNNCWQAIGTDGSHTYVYTEDFDCGTMGCIGAEYTLQDGILKYNRNQRLQCEKNNDANYICYVVQTKYVFQPINKKHLIEKYNNPYVSYISDNKLILIDLSQDCYNLSGCQAFNYEIKHGKYLKTYPFVDIVCYGQVVDNKIYCQKKADFIDAN